MENFKKFTDHKDPTKKIDTSLVTLLDSFIVFVSFNELISVSSSIYIVGVLDDLL